MVVAMCLLVAWVESDLRKREVLKIKQALVLAGITPKEMAAAMGIPVKRLYKQLDGHEGLNLWLVAKLPVAFHLAYWRLSLEEMGHEVIAPGEMQELMCRVRQLLDRVTALVNVFRRRRKAA